jgi:hypothetical protein
MGLAEDQGQMVATEVKDVALAAGKADAALEFLRDEDTGVAVVVNEKALVRKIDWMIMPLMWAAYNLQYLDKVLSRFMLGCKTVMDNLADSCLKSTMPP